MSSSGGQLWYDTRHGGHKARRGHQQIDGHTVLFTDGESADYD